MTSYNNAAKHYSSLLAPIYSWMVGDFELACKSNTSFFDSIGLEPGATGRAVDLGCGHGIQSVALARRGFEVFAIDNSKDLLAELKNNVDRLPVTSIFDDLLNVSQHVKNADAIVCMGDTLTHLASEDLVKQLFLTCANLLAPSGTFILSYRNYADGELVGNDRFIPVRSDARRIHTCFLEYLPTTVIVHDIVHTFNEIESKWETAVGSYPKIRLSPESVIEIAANNELTLTHNSVERGMLRMVFEKQN